MNFSDAYIEELKNNEYFIELLELKKIIDNKYSKLIITFKTNESLYNDSLKNPSIDNTKIKEAFIKSKTELYSKEEVKRYFELEEIINNKIVNDFNEIKKSISNKFIIDNIFIKKCNN